MQSFNSEEWGNIWSEGRGSVDEIHSAIVSESASVRCRKILAYLKMNLGELSNISTIEIGCGAGIYSLILAGLGAKVTFFDYSSEALKLAEQNLRSLGLDGILVQGDAFQLPQTLKNFDVSMSFGTVEHYRYPARRDICQAHVNLIRPGGVAVISAPNLFFFPHEFLKAVLKLKGKWYLGYEGSFSRFEMFRMGNKLDLVGSKIIGSSFPGGVKRYKEIIKGTATFRRLFGDRDGMPVAMPNGDVQPDHWLDDYIGQDIVLMGMKPGL